MIAASSASQSDPVASPQAGPTIEGIQVAVHMEKAVYENANCVCLALYLTNVSGHTISVPHADAGDPAVNFEIIVKNSKHQTLSLRPKYSQTLTEERRAAKPVTYSLGGVIGETMKLNNMYNLIPGKYSISVKHAVPRQDGKGIVEAVSYPAYFTILR